MIKNLVSLVIFAVLVLTSTYSFSSELKPFESDGCSAFPNGTFTQKNLWLDCCVEHDKAYWQGGTVAQRAGADQQLKSCVVGVDQPWIGNLMLAGVRVGGLPYWPTPFRWGFGWPYMRGYEALTEEEQREVKVMLESQDVNDLSVETGS